ncbi:universal stress protein [Streptomyces sp.]|uniref:universal stress protein n=1 Tax=Streptomyces sp. TaxID=1931 RepID=UPI002D77F3E5|nr:universal stress protein [Streptomyces sp.]HET6358060.1 universal stress protein [Streptomyces sp.]
MTRNVAVGLDGTPESLAAAEWAAREALLRGVPLHLVHVEEGPSALTRPALAPEMQRTWAEEMLEKSAADVRQRHPELEVTTRHYAGQQPPALLATAASETELLVLGSRGLGSVAGFLLGSVGLATVSATEQPVVLVRAAKGRTSTPSDSAPAEYRDVVLGVDIRQDCDAVMAFAFDAAARRAARLRVVHGWKMPMIYTQFAAVDAGQQIAQGLSDMLMPWRQKFPSVKVVEQAVFGGASQQLVYESADAELVVVGRRIQEAPLAAHIGPVTHAVLHHSAAPVAVIAHR